MPLKIGFGKYNTTPPFGVDMWGYDKRQGEANYLHDPLWATAVVFDDGKTSAAVVTADIIGINPDQVDRIGRLVEQWTGIPRRHIIAAGTHTHSGPSFQKRRRSGRGPTAEELYAGLLPDLMASAVKRAWDDRRAATLAAASTETKDLTVNRRDPGGTTDEELALLCVKRRGELAGVILNFACHGVVMGPDNLALSGDWIGLTRAALAAELPGAFPLVTVAPSGNINPLPQSIRRQIREKGVEYFTNDPFSGIYDRAGGTFAEAEQMAGSLVRATLKAIEHAAPAPTTGGVAVTTRTADIGEGSTSIRVPLRMIRTGRVVFVGMPGEQFVETGIRVKQAIRQLGLIPVVLTHSPNLAYVPTPEAFAQHKEHDYEVDWARQMGMAEDAADRELRAIERGLRILAK